MPSSFLCSLNDTLVIPHELIFVRVLIAKERFGKVGVELRVVHKVSLRGFQTPRRH